MAVIYVYAILFLKFDFVIKISASPQLDIPSFALNYTKNLKVINGPRDFSTNGHSEKIVSDTVTNRDQSNEIGSDDALRYDRDRSNRYGPPYSYSEKQFIDSENNDQRYYNNYRNDDNSRYYSRENEDIDDDDDKYYSQPRSPYYISEKQRNRYGYRDYYSTVSDLPMNFKIFFIYIFFYLIK